jgi:hypothetical protein
MMEQITCQVPQKVLPHCTPASPIQHCHALCLVGAEHTKDVLEVDGEVGVMDKGGY